MMRTESIEAYNYAQSKPKMKEVIYQAFKELGPCHDALIVKEKGIPVNIVTGRRNQLIADGRMEHAGKIKTTKTVNAWRVK